MSCELRNKKWKPLAMVLMMGLELATPRLQTECSSH